MDKPPKTPEAITADLWMGAWNTTAGVNALSQGALKGLANLNALGPVDARERTEALRSLEWTAAVLVEEAQKAQAALDAFLARLDQVARDSE
jgi:hypothetical protein